MRGLAIGTVRVVNYGDDFNEAIKHFNLNVKPVTNLEQNINLPIAGRIATLLGINLTVTEYIHRYGYQDRISACDKPYYEQGYHIGLSKKSGAERYIPRINEAIARLKASGEPEELLSEYIVQ